MIENLSFSITERSFYGPFIHLLVNQFKGSQLFPYVFFAGQVDRVYVSSANMVAILDHEKKRTFVIRKVGLPDVGKSFSLFS